jgi:anti-anti-sigma factor
MVTKNDLSGLLIVRLSDVDFQGQDIQTQIKNKLAFIVETGSATQLLINLENVSFLGSAAIGQLIMLKKKCDQKQIALALCNISWKNKKVLQMVRFDEVVDIFDQPDSAIESLQKTLVPEPHEPLSKDEYAELSKSAHAGDVDAAFELAQRKSDGRGIRQDPTDAMYWYLTAAKQGHREAQFELATCYAFGLGVPQDYTLAMPWYDKAADQDHAESQYMLGMSFQFALNDTKDISIARSWYEKAAAHGHEKAKLALKDLPD